MRPVILAMFLYAMPLPAAIFYPIDTTCPLNCRFSQHQHNRILIEDGRIKKVIFPEEKLYVRMEETSGQVFIQAKNHLREKTVISIVSQGGVVQDIEIEFADQPSEVVVLQENSCNQYPILQEACAVSSNNSVIESILQGQIPPGFLSIPTTHSSKKIARGTRAKLVGRLQSSNEDLYLYQIQNTRLWKKRLQERDLACCDTLWVYLQKRCLRSKETALAIVARPL